MNALKHVLKARGLVGTAWRITEILANYGLAEKKFSRKTELYASIMSKYNAKPSFAVTGVLLKRHNGYLSQLAGNAELLAHGFRHIDHMKLSSMEQKNELKKAFEAFRQAGLQAKGFRAPYLRSNAELRMNLNGFFQYDSSVSILYASEIKLTADKTIGQDKALPYREGVLELMVSLPSDVCLQKANRGKEAGRIWSSMLKQAHERGEMLILLIHPEYIEEYSKPLEGLLEYSRQLGGVWTATMEEIASWWARKKEGENWPDGFKCALSVTGDIDAVTIQDYIFRILGS